MNRAVRSSDERVELPEFSNTTTILARLDQYSNKAPRQKIDTAMQA
jgi:hypothetical protein